MMCPKTGFYQSQIVTFHCIGVPIRLTTLDQKKKEKTCKRSDQVGEKEGPLDFMT